MSVNAMIEYIRKVESAQPALDRLRTLASNLQLSQVVQYAVAHGWELADHTDGTYSLSKPEIAESILFDTSPFAGPDQVVLALLGCARRSNQAWLSRIVDAQALIQDIEAWCSLQQLLDDLHPSPVNPDISCLYAEAQAVS